MRRALLALLLVLPVTPARASAPGALSPAEACREHERRLVVGALLAARSIAAAEPAFDRRADALRGWFAANAPRQDCPAGPPYDLAIDRHGRFRVFCPAHDLFLPGTRSPKTLAGAQGDLEGRALKLGRPAEPPRPDFDYQGLTPGFREAQVVIEARRDRAEFIRELAGFGDVIASYDRRLRDGIADLKLRLADWRAREDDPYATPAAGFALNDRLLAAAARLRADLGFRAELGRQAASLAAACTDAELEAAYRESVRHALADLEETHAAGRLLFVDEPLLAERRLTQAARDRVRRAGEMSVICRENRRRIAAAVRAHAREYGAPPQSFQLPDLLAPFPACPAGGAYALDPDGNVLCDAHEAEAESGGPSSSTSNYSGRDFK